MEDAIRTTDDMASADATADAPTVVTTPMSPDDLTNLRLKLHRGGYRPVPVLGAHVAMKAAGKRPMMKGWETVCASADETEITRWTKAQRNCTNTGLLCGDLVGVDIDVLDRDHAHRLTCIATEMLGMSPLSRIGRAPKILLAFRTDAPFDKVQTSEFHMLDGTVARVEVLATGQQFVGFGIHPDTKAPYHWPECSPLDVPKHELPVVSQGRCAAFIAAAESYLRKVSGQTTSDRREIDREGRKAAGLKQKEAPSREMIEEAVAHISNDELPYDDWIKVGLALYAALGPDGRDLWETWSAEASKNDPVYSAEKWDSFANVRSVTVGTLFWLARQNGWRAERAQRMRPARPTRNPDDADEDTPDDDARPAIRIYAGFLHETVDMAEGALMQAGLGYYQRGSMVVRPAMVPVAIADGRKIDAPRLVDVKAHHMAEAFTRAANWKRFDKREGKWLSTDCPHRIAETFLVREGQWRLPVLTGIINCPTLRPDGSILDLPGYDAQTGLLFDPQDVHFPMLPRDPDRATAQRALAFLKDLISTFPFVTDADRSVALSGILTALIRRSLPTAPLHGFNAPTAGTGKSMLVDLASLIATARPAPVIAQGKSEEEMEKRLGAALIAGDVLIAIDNCEEPLGGELLCQTLTQTSLKVRILGRSVNAEVPSNAAVFATGNNLTLEGDMRLHELDQFEDAALVKAKVAALFTGFITDPDGTAGGLSGTNTGGALTVGMEPGSLIPLPPGTDIRFSSPTESDAYAPFVKNHLRAVAAGMGLPYELVSGDLEGVTYSSIRAGLIEFRRRVEQLQHNVVVHMFCRPVWERFVRLAVLTGELPARDFDRNATAYLGCEWLPPKFDYVDPKKDVEAEILAIHAGLKSRSQAISERGYDAEQVDAEIAADKERADGLHLTFGQTVAAQQKEPADG